MTTNQPQFQACSYCGSLKFGVVRNVWIELVSDAKATRGKVVRPRFDVVVCQGCGLTQMFARKDENYLLDTRKHEVIDLSSPNPYR